VDPFTLLMAAQGIVAGIRQGCDLLRQGKAQIGELKKAVGEAQAFVTEAKSLWTTVKSFWQSIFGGKKDATSKPTPNVSPVQPAEPAPTQQRVEKKANRKQAEPELSYEEFQARAIHDICEKLKQFFEIKRKLNDYCRQLEEESKTTQDIEGAALDRIQIEMQIEQMTVQIREAMIYTPKEIGLADIYSRFLRMYNQILEERELDRQLKLKQKREEEWQRDYRRRLRVDKTMYAIAAFLIYLQLVGIFSALSLGTGWLSFPSSSSS